MKNKEKKIDVEIKKKDSFFYLEVKLSADMREKMKEILKETANSIPSSPRFN